MPQIKSEPMKLQFKHQDHQIRAVTAVSKVFDGQPLASSIFSLAGNSTSLSHAPDGAIGNVLLLSDEQLLANVQQVQRENSLAPSSELEPSWSDNNKEQFCPRNFTLEMETGTGKTYTFIKTMYELNKLYGFNKFVIVVPSVAIREGAIKNIEATREHFAADYANVPFVSVLFDSARLNDLRHFAQSDALSVLVINIDSFTGDHNKINQKGEKAFAPIEYIRSVNPIVIVDEPQNFETDIRRRALMELNPLCTLRYSATHNNPYNMLYSLSPVAAYDLGLVKQIEVDGILADESHNEAFIELISIEPKAKVMTAKVIIDVNEATGVKRKRVSLKVGDDLFKKSKGRDLYKEGYILNEFLGDDEIQFSGKRVLRLGETQDGLNDEVMRFQIERPVASHFAKLKNLQPIGVKVLSLFFIDKVANYRSFDHEGNAIPGKFAQWFEAAFIKYAAMPAYHGLIPYPASAVHDGYFSGDKKGKGSAAKTVWIDSTERGSKKDEDTYSLIMRDKERLLGSDEPLQFIFSHSALREGWDNPNVFQICTLNETRSGLKKRQEIGRGLRLCVDQNGERVHDKRVNVLTVIPNDSYEHFARELQIQIEDETGVSFTGRVKNARAKVKIKRRTLSAEEESLFKAIWQKINFQTRYSVRLDTPDLIQSCVAALRDKDQYPPVQAPKIRARKARLVMNGSGVHGVANGIKEEDAIFQHVVIPDVYGYIQHRVHLSRSTIFSILDGSDRLAEMMVNPQAFLDLAIAAIKQCLKAKLVEGIEYHEINGCRYEMTLFSEEIETYQSNIYPPANDGLTASLSKTLLEARPLDEGQALADAFSCVLSDSAVESKFAKDCALDERVKFFFKLPGTFKIPTPLGNYNPDWALVFEDDSRVYFVAETKSSTVEGERRPDENLKIRCGRKHFERMQDVVYKDVELLEQLINTANNAVK